MNLSHIPLNLSGVFPLPGRMSHIPGLALKAVHGLWSPAQGLCLALLIPPLAVGPAFPWPSPWGDVCRSCENSISLESVCIKDLHVRAKTIKLRDGTSKLLLHQEKKKNPLASITAGI